MTKGRKSWSSSRTARPVQEEAQDHLLSSPDKEAHAGIPAATGAVRAVFCGSDRRNSQDHSPGDGPECAEAAGTGAERGSINIQWRDRMGEKIYRVNMATLSVSSEDVPREWSMLGGRGLTSTIVAQEVKPTCHPLGRHNKLVFAPGLLDGNICDELRQAVGRRQKPADRHNQRK